MEDLYAGVKHFQKVLFYFYRDEFRVLSKGQSPRTLFVTCSDSRIVPSLITRTGPGDLFVARNPGNIVPAFGSDGGGESAAVEYAVEVLGVKNIVVCGHTDCGAMNGLLNPDALEQLPMMRSWLSRCGHKADGLEGGLDALTRRNVCAQLGNLRTYPAVASREAAGSLELHGWLYEIGTGHVLVHDASSHEFRPLPRTTAAA